MEIWQQNTIWFEDLPNDIFAQIHYKENKASINLLSNNSYVILWNYNVKNKNLINLPENNKLKYLELNLSNCESFEGISNFKTIKRLELHYCSKLASDIGISSISNTIEWLHINMSKKFVLTSELEKLKKLKVLCLNNCGSIDNLNFLNSLPDLVDFRFVNTNIKSGDLNPILEHKKLTNAGFLNKKHYNYKAETIEEILKKRKPDLRVPINKGEYKSFSYNVFE